MTTQISCSKPLFGILLFLSLTANVFFGGMVVGKHMYGGEGMGGFKVGKLLSALQSLSPESRDKAVASAEKDWPAVQAQLKAVREKRDAVKQLLVKPEYKEEDLDKAMSDVRTEVNKLIDTAQTLGKGVLKNVTPEERQKLIRMLPRPPAE
jgi:hypothetical protein